MTALAGVELESLVSEPDALTTSPFQQYFIENILLVTNMRNCSITAKIY